VKFGKRWLAILRASTGKSLNEMKSNKNA